ncbi:uncharacterized protein LOC121739371 [Aricia agestis]|uniref:uncharacterized protein LOC121739371 n=1 Tax=Aricia agestis TaxID=91739 RepID=UPI001C205D00|nr:uncharacterized protein LOC121739371 [Aricia agestis]
METDDEKSKLAKLLQDLEVPELKLPEKCNDVIRYIRQKFETENDEEPFAMEEYDNPYVVDKNLLLENERKLKELIAESRREKRDLNISLSESDIKRPWRINSHKEKLARIDSKLKRHSEKSKEAINPVEENQMRFLIQECEKEGQVSCPVSANRLQEIVLEAKKDLPNFQYQVQNTTATNILPEAHTVVNKKN